MVTGLVHRHLLPGLDNTRLFMCLTAGQLSSVESSVSYWRPEAVNQERTAAISPKNAPQGTNGGTKGLKVTKKYEY